jgi:hypothetical protein
MYIRALALLTLLFTSISSFGAIVIWNSAGTTFVSGDIVIYDSKNYVALGSATNSTLPPDQDTANFLDIEQSMPEKAPTTAAPEWTAEQIAEIQAEAEALSAPDSNASDVQVNGLVSLSVRGHVGTADYIRIMGFVLSGSESVLLRGLGPVLGQNPYNVTGDLLNNPKITLWKYNSASNIKAGSTTESGWSNDNYTDAGSIKTARESVVPVVSKHTNQAGLLSSLTSNFYTLHMQDAGVPQDTGIGNAAVDLVNSSSAIFKHLSSRGIVKSDAEGSMFGSFQISGTATRKIYIRARGPSLSGSGYDVPSPVSDPSIIVKKYVNDPNDDQTDPATLATLVAENDDFEDNATTSESVLNYSTSLYGWPKIETDEAGLVLDLVPGYYSVELKVGSADNGKIAWIGIDDVTDL